MRQRHAIYLSQAMTQRLQVMAETHRVAKSEILERALKRYLANESGDPPADLQALQQASNTRSLRRLERDLAIAAGVDSDIRALLLDDYTAAAREASTRRRGRSVNSGSIR